MRLSRFAFPLILATVTLLPTAATADTVTRGGLLVGGGGGFGRILCSGCTAVNGFALNLVVGTTLPDREDVAVLIDSSIVRGSQTIAETQVTERVWSGAYVAAGQYWVLPNVWVRAGAGVGRVSGLGTAPAANGLALLGAAGYERGVTDRVALSLGVRVTSTGYDFARVNNYSALVGATWY